MPRGTTRRDRGPHIVAAAAAIACVIGCAPDPPPTPPGVTETPADAPPGRRDAEPIGPPPATAVGPPGAPTAAVPPADDAKVAEPVTTDRLAEAFAAWRALGPDTRLAARRAAVAIAEAVETRRELLAASELIVVDATDGDDAATVTTARGRLLDAFAELGQTIAALSDEATGFPDETAESPLALAAELLAASEGVAADPESPPLAATATFYDELTVAFGSVALATNRTDVDAAVAEAIAIASRAFEPVPRATSEPPFGRIAFVATPPPGADAESRRAFVERVAVAVDRPHVAAVEAVERADGGLAITCGPVTEPGRFRTRLTDQIGGAGSWTIGPIEPLGDDR